MGISLFDVIGRRLVIPMASVETDPPNFGFTLVTAFIIYTNVMPPDTQEHVPQYGNTIHFKPPTSFLFSSLVIL